MKWVLNSLFLVFALGVGAGASGQQDQDHAEWRWLDTIYELEEFLGQDLNGDGIIGRPPIS